MQDLLIGLGGLVVAAAGFVLAYAVFRREAARAEKGCGERDGMLLSEIGYVKSGVDDIKAHQREQDNRHLDMVERVTAVEQSAKQAHRRIDRMEQGRGEEL